MYEGFYGFSARPFDLTPDPRYLVATEMHREALSNLEYTILSRKGITLLVGEDGTGKTVRTPGTTMVTGTAESGDGVFEVSITI